MRDLKGMGRAPTRRQPGVSPRGRQGGLAALELALVAPIMMLMVMGGFDLYRHVQANAIIDRLAFTLAHELSQAPGLPFGPQCGGNRAAAGCGAHTVAQQLAVPLDYAATRLDVAVYRVRQDAAGWQTCWSTAGGALPDTTRFPAGPAGSTVVAVIVSYRHAPNLLPRRTLQAQAISRATGARASSLCP